MFDSGRFIQDSSLFSVWFRQVYTGFQFIQCLIQAGLYRIPVYSVFDSGRFIQDSSLFSVWFRQVYTGFQFIQCLIQAGLYRIPVYSVFDSGRFIQDSSLFSVWFRQVYTGFQFIQCLIQAGLTVHCYSYTYLTYFLLSVQFLFCNLFHFFGVDWIWVIGYNYVLIQSRYLIWT